MSPKREQGSLLPRWRWGLVLLACTLLVGCMQDMARQPKYRPLRPSGLFEDGRAARSLVPGTVARGQLRDDPLLYHGLDPAGQRQAQLTQAAGLFGELARGDLGSLGALLRVPAETPYVDVLKAYADEFPYPVTMTVLERGRDRFNIFCAVCHDRAGTGNGMIPRRGFTRPPSFHTDDSRGLRRRKVFIRLRDAPVGYYFDVITNGYGAMADHAAQVPPEDRWAIVAYIRALQLSQHVTAKDVPSEEWQRLTKTLGPRP